ncbi:YihY family inner membrane protein [Roseospira navarrensis]|nr:YihY family inner membrane protein [Roseospira navarrensis]
MTGETAPAQTDRNPARPKGGRAAAWMSVRDSMLLLGRMTLNRVEQTQAVRMAASLSYTSLLAMVPLLAIALAMLAAFPVFAEVRGAIMDSLFEVLFPYADETVRTRVEDFVRAAGGLTAFGLIGIAVTAIMLLVTIETALNGIFGVKAARAVLARLLIYWALVTLGPMLLGASFSLSGYIYALQEVASEGPAILHGLSGLATRALPWLLTALAFTLLYLVVPYRAVHPRDALVGGVAAAALVAALRFGFLIYVTNAEAYQTLYGALAVIPVFLVWMYLSWLVVLAGAVITAVLPVWRMERQEGAEPRRQDLNAALRVLHRLQKEATRVQRTSRRRVPAGVGRRRLLLDTGLPEERLRRILTDLETAGLVARAEGGRWLLGRDLDAVTLDDLMGLLDLRMPDGGPMSGGPWAETVGARLNDARAAERETLSVPLKALLQAES